MIVRNEKRKVRHLRTRKKVNGTAVRPRLSVFKSNKIVSVQLIDDVTGTTLVASSTKNLNVPKTVDGCKELGKDIANKAKEKGIASVVFDKSGYKYHGRLAAIADSAREAGLKI